MGNKYHKYILLLIILLAAFLRFWKLGSYPALNADEAAIGYNAYSLLETGKDEHGNPWPIHFQSFNDYKPGLYFYMVLPFVKFIGLNAWSVRIPGTLFGLLTIYLVYLLVGELFDNKKLEIGDLKLGTGHIASFLLAISPWHIHFSRGGWEVNVATFFIVLGLWFFLKGLNNIVYLFLSSLVFTLSLYAYHSARVITPLIGVGLFLIYFKYVRKHLLNFALAALVGLVTLMPLAKDLTKGNITSRMAGVGLFADTGPLARTNEQRGEHNNFQGLFSKTIHNKLVNYGLAFTNNWVKHYNGEFLFLSGDVIERNRVPETGQMYLFDILFIVCGIIFVIKSSLSQYFKSYTLILWWLIVAPVGAALTFQSPHALRAQNMVVPLTIISATGLSAIIYWIKELRFSKFIKSFVYLFIGLFVIWNFTRYEHMYWVHMAKEYPFSSQYGIKELVNYVEENGDKFNKIVVSNRYDQPYILFLFYLKYPPARFQGNHELTQRDTYNFSTVRNFDKFEFNKINWDEDRVKYPGALFAGTDKEILEESNIVEEIYGTNGYKYFQIVAN